MKVPYDHGRFVWFELATHEPERASEFYAAVLGWSVTGHEHYWALRRSGSSQDMGGLIPTPSTELSPQWVGYFSVKDVGRVAARATAKGGQAESPPLTIAGVGEVAPMRDPEGSVFCLFKGDHGDPLPERGPGAWFWVELFTGDAEFSAAYYAAVLGVRADRAQGDAARQTVLWNGGPVASVTPARDGLPRGWLPYVAVEDLDGAVSVALERGATFPVAPVSVAAGRCAVMRDPEGAHVGLVQPG